MLVLSRKLKQEIVFPTIGVTIEVTRFRGSTVCLGIDAPREIPILRGELTPMDSRPLVIPCDDSGASLQESLDQESSHSRAGHELRNRLNSLSLCLRIMKEYQDANMPIDNRILSRALHELHTVEEIMACGNAQNPFLRQLEHKEASPFVMLIDDSVNEAELLASYLRHFGIQVAMSTDGNAALNLLECIERKPDVILLDMVMPGMDGQQTLSQLRGNPEYNCIKIFAVTGLPAESMADSHQLVVDRWFQKPIHPPELVEQIRSEAALVV